MEIWNDRLEDDGADRTSERALGALADRVVAEVLRSLRRALAEGDLPGQWQAQLALELARMMRRDLKRGSWARLAVPDRNHLRRAFLALGTFSRSRTPIPLA